MSQDYEQAMELVNNLTALWNAHDTAHIGDIYSNDFVGKDVAYPPLVTGHEGLAAQMDRYFEAFPDLEFTNEKVVVQSDTIALYWRARGTHRGTLMNIPATGRQIDVCGTTILTVHDGKVQDAVHVWDMAGLLRTIGLLPDPNPPENEFESLANNLPLKSSEDSSEVEIS